MADPDPQTVPAPTPDAATDTAPVDDIVVTGQRPSAPPPRRGPNAAAVAGEVIGSVLSGSVLEDAARKGLKGVFKEASGRSATSEVAATRVAAADAAIEREYGQPAATASQGLGGSIAGMAIDALKRRAVNTGLEAATGGAAGAVRGAYSAITSNNDLRHQHYRAIEALAAEDMPGFEYREVQVGDKTVKIYVDATEDIGERNNDHIFTMVDGEDGLSAEQKEMVKRIKAEMEAQARRDIDAFEAQHPEATTERQKIDAYEASLNRRINGMMPITVNSDLKGLESQFMKGELTLDQLADKYAEAINNKGDMSSERDVRKAIDRLVDRGVLDESQRAAFEEKVDQKAETLAQGDFSKQLQELEEGFKSGDVSRADLAAAYASHMDVADLADEDRLVAESIDRLGLTDAEEAALKTDVAKELNTLQNPDPAVEMGAVTPAQRPATPAPAAG